MTTLHRAELSKLERSNEIAEWVKLCDEVSSQFAKKPQGGRPEGGINAASRELGIDKDEAYRAVKIASISPEAKEAASQIKTAETDKADKGAFAQYTVALKKKHDRKESRTILCNH